VAVSVATDVQWRALCGAMQREDLARDPALESAAGRLQQQDRLDAAIAGWTVQYDMTVVEARLQAVGVPAHAVQNSRELCVDPQLQARGHFISVQHPDRPAVTLEGTRFVLSRTPAAYDTTAPTYGRDNEYVLRELLGYDDDQITALVAAGALE
jgi:crotonobetainyl-CoA:carnitine CoA-transferase CaiB-like acyl-CoA transferase